MFLIIQEMFKSDNVYLLIYHLLRQYKKNIDHLYITLWENAQTFSRG